MLAPASVSLRPTRNPDLEMAACLKSLDACLRRDAPLQEFCQVPPVGTERDDEQILRVLQNVLVSPRVQEKYGEASTCKLSACSWRDQPGSRVRKVSASGLLILSSILQFRWIGKSEDDWARPGALMNANMLLVQNMACEQEERGMH